MRICVWIFRRALFLSLAFYGVSLVCPNGHGPEEGSGKGALGATFQDAILKLKKQVERLVSKRDSLSIRNENLREDSQELQDRNNQLNAQIVALEEKIKTLEAENRALSILRAASSLGSPPSESPLAFVRSRSLPILSMPPQALPRSMSLPTDWPPPPSTPAGPPLLSSPSISAVLVVPKLKPPGLVEAVAVPKYLEIGRRKPDLVGAKFGNLVDGPAQFTLPNKAKITVSVRYEVVQRPGLNDGDNAKYSSVYAAGAAWRLIAGGKTSLARKQLATMFSSWPKGGYGTKEGVEKLKTSVRKYVASDFPVNGLVFIIGEKFLTDTAANPADFAQSSPSVALFQSGQPVTIIFASTTGERWFTVQLKRFTDMKGEYVGAEVIASENEDYRKHWVVSALVKIFSTVVGA